MGVRMRETRSADAASSVPAIGRGVRAGARTTLRREPWSVPASSPYLGEDPLVPLRAGEQVGWKLVGGA